MALSIGGRAVIARLARMDFGKPLFWAFLGLLAWLPIPLGSNRPWAWTVLEVAAFVLLAAWLVLWALRRVEVPLPLSRAWPAWIVLAAWILLQASHVIAVPSEWVAILSPEAARMQSA